METFVVRVWVPTDEADAAAPPKLRGVVERLGLTDARPFHDGEQLLDLLRASLAAGPNPGGCPES